MACNFFPVRILYLLKNLTEKLCQQTGSEKIKGQIMNMNELASSIVTKSGWIENFRSSRMGSNGEIWTR